MDYTNESTIDTRNGKLNDKFEVQRFYRKLNFEENVTIEDKFTDRRNREITCPHGCNSKDDYYLCSKHGLRTKSFCVEEKEFYCQRCRNKKAFQPTRTTYCRGKDGFLTVDTHGIDHCIHGIWHGTKYVSPKSDTPMCEECDSVNSVCVHGFKCPDFDEHKNKADVVIDSEFPNESGWRHRGDACLERNIQGANYIFVPYCHNSQCAKFVIDISDCKNTGDAIEKLKSKPRTIRGDCFATKNVVQKSGGQKRETKMRDAWPFNLYKSFTTTHKNSHRYASYYHLKDGEITLEETLRKYDKKASARSHKSKPTLSIRQPKISENEDPSYENDWELGDDEIPEGCEQYYKL